MVLAKSKASPSKLASPSKSKAVKRPELTLEQKVSKILRESYSMLGPEERDVRLHPTRSLTLRQLLRADLEALTVDGRVHMGPLYHEHNRAIFQDGHTPAAAGSAATVDLVRPALMKAMIKATTGRRDRTSMLEQCAILTNPVNEHEASGLLAWGATLRLGCHLRQLPAALKLVDCFLRLDMHKTHPTIFAKEKSWFNTLYYKCFVLSKESCEAFARSRQKMLELCLPEDDLAKVLDSWKEPRSVFPSLMRLVQSGAMGRCLFEGLLRAVVQHEVEHTVTTTIESQMAMEREITSSVIREIKLACSTAVSALPGVDLCPAQREVCLHYGSLELRGVRVGSLLQHIELALSAAVRAQAVAKGQLLKLHNEDIINTKPSPSTWKCTIHVDAVAAAARARSSWNRWLEAPEITGADDIEGVIARESTRLQLIDPDCEIEKLVLRQLTGEHATSHFCEKIVLELASQEVAIAPEISLQRLQALASSRIYALCARSAQGIVDSAMRILARLVADTPLELDIAGSDETAGKMLKAMGHFLRFDDGEGTTATGRKAWELKLEMVEAKIVAKKAVPTDTRELLIFKYLIKDSDELVQRLADAHAAVQSKATDDLEELRSLPARPAAAAAKRARLSITSGHAEALQMFRLR